VVEDGKIGGESIYAPAIGSAVAAGKLARPVQKMAVRDLVGAAPQVDPRQSVVRILSEFGFERGDCRLKRRKLGQVVV
jgi:hypothetical protein